MAAKSRKSANAVLYVVFALLIFSLGGFGVRNFGASVRSIGAVGGTEITMSEYSLALQNAITRAQRQGGAPPSLATPEGQSFANAVRAQLYGTAALKEETARLGLSISDERVRDAVLADTSFQGLDGKFDRNLYNRLLNRAGFKESQYEDDIRAREASQITLAAVTAGMDTHETMVSILADYRGERRDLAMIKLDATALETPIPEPTEAELQATYEANPDLYTAPEMRDITYVALTPEMVLDKITVDEDELRKLYEERAADYNRPERRLVERLVFPDQAAADAAKEALDGGATFESLVQGRGLSLTDIDLGDVTKEDLGAAGTEIFAAEGPGLVGPIETSLGPALFRINAVLAAEVTPFEDVRDDLTDELQRDRASRFIAERQEAIDDLLAGGATLEDVANETDMELGTIRIGPDTAEGMAAYSAFREAAQAVTQYDFPELIQLEDGGLAALRLDAVIPPTLQPLDVVRDKVVADWTLGETEARLGDLGEAIRAARLEGKTFEEQGYTPEMHTGLARESYLDGAPDGMIDSLFAMNQGDVVVFAEGETLHVIELTKITPLSEDDADTTALRASIAGGVARAEAEDVQSLFLAAVEAQAGITINQAAINAVHANQP